MSRTTPPRPVDITAVFPQLAPLARTATRLHPRAGSPAPHDSSVGGPLLWPADEPWPHCEGPHKRRSLARPVLSPGDVRLLRRIQAAVASRRGLGREASRPTPEELAAEKRIRAGRPWPEGPAAMLPVAQLYARDIPDLRPPGQSGADLLQILWCPFHHPIMPRTALFWRSAAAVTDRLTTPPEPSAVATADYVLEPCLLTPEQITEFPHPRELSNELRDALADRDTWQAADAGPDGSSASDPEELYRNSLSVAPGWKVGGWPFWGPTDPKPRQCPTCSTEMDPLLTIATFEWDDDTRSWSPHGSAEREGTGTPTAKTGPEAQALIDFFRARGVAVHDRGRIGRPQTAQPVTDPALRQPTAVQIADGDRQQIYICPRSPEHPHMDLMQ